MKKLGFCNNNGTITKAIAAAIPMAGILAAAALLSGLSLIGTNAPTVLAQQKMTDTTGTSTIGGGEATTIDGEGGAGGNQSTTISEAIMHLQEARTALQNNDTQGAMMELDIALNVLGNATEGGNVTTTTATALGDNATGRYGGGVSGSAGGGDVQQ
jgi:hypothetical protein